MRLCNDTITVFNAWHDQEKDVLLYFGTVITGVSWYSTVAAAVVDTGLKTASKTTVRIPIDADFGGKVYMDPAQYRAMATPPGGVFTLQNGDIIVKGVASGYGLKPPELRKQYTDVVEILGVTDNRRAPNAKHWRVTGT